MHWIWNLAVACLLPAVGMAGTHLRVAIDDAPLEAADVYLYSDPDRRTWIATVAAGVADIPDDAVETALQGANGDWQWVIVTADELVYASPGQPAEQRDWRAALAAMGSSSSPGERLNLPAPVELEAEIVRPDGRPAGHTYASIARVFDDHGPCGQMRTLAPDLPGASANDAGRIGWRLAPGRYLLRLGDDTHLVETGDHKDDNRLATRRYTLSERRQLHIRVRQPDAREAPGVMLGSFVDACVLRNFGSTDGEGALSAWVGANELSTLALRGSNDDGSTRLQVLGSVATEAWREGRQLDLVWHGRAEASVRLPTPEVSVTAVLPSLLDIRFLPPQCLTGDGRPDCRYELCDADRTDACLPMIGPDAQGRRWARVPAGSTLRWKARAVVTEGRMRWRASLWTSSQSMRMPPAPISAPTAPEHCVAKPLSPYAASIQWRDRSADEYGFELAACLADAPESCRRMALVDRDSGDFTLHGLPAGTALLLRLNAFNPAGNSSSCTAMLSMPIDDSLDSAITDWTARYGSERTAAANDDVDAESLRAEDDGEDALPFKTECVSRATLLSSISPRYTLAGRRRIDAVMVDVFSIDDNDGFCHRAGCGLHAFGSTGDRPDCYRWLGEVVPAAPSTSMPQRPAISVDLGDARERLRWFRTDNDVEVDRLELCGSDGDRPARDLLPPYQLDRYGRPGTCQLRPWHGPDELGQ